MINIFITKYQHIIIIICYFLIKINKKYETLKIYEKYNKKSNINKKKSMKNCVCWKNNIKYFSNNGL